MKELTSGWKLFKLGSILQMINVLFHLVITIPSLIYPGSFLIGLLSTLSYCSIGAFLYLGLSILNNNYPDIPLAPSHKRNFNRLFILNFLAIAILFAELFNKWRNLFPLLLGDSYEFDGEEIFLIVLFLFIPLFLFVFHFVFLVGMYRLRKLLHTNQETDWEKQFE